MYEQATIAPVNNAAFARMLHGLQDLFAPLRAENFLKHVARAKMRVRDFETILQRGMFGADSQAYYTAMAVSDRGLIREEYLSLVERVAPELREKYMKIYAYY
jgi:hypothetical protein